MRKYRQRLKKFQYPCTVNTGAFCLMAISTPHGIVYAQIKNFSPDAKEFTAEFGEPFTKIEFVYMGEVFCRIFDYAMTQKVARKQAEQMVMDVKDGKF